MTGCRTIPDQVIVGGLTLTDTIQLDPDARADLAAQSFERYDPVSAPVVDEDRKLVRRVTVNVVLDLIRAESEAELVNQAGLCERGDIFASVWKSARNCRTWLALKLCTAFFASRVIGGFENTIAIVMTGAMLLNLILGARVGLFIPLAMQKMGRDPAIGSGVMITVITNSGGFFLFLGLATISLVR